MLQNRFLLLLCQALTFLTFFLYRLSSRVYCVYCVHHYVLLIHLDDVITLLTTLFVSVYRSALGLENEIETALFLFTFRGLDTPPVFLHRRWSSVISRTATRFLPRFFRFRTVPTTTVVASGR